MAVSLVYAQEKILKEISDIDGVEVTYITKKMLQSMAKSGNLSIEGLSLSKIAKDLSSLQVLVVEGKSVLKVRNKLKSIGNGMELIMKIKDDDERTDMYGVKKTDDNYSKLFLCVDKSDEITIVYMTGNIGSDCFNELSKKAKVKGSMQKANVSIVDKNILIDLSTFDWSNSMVDISALYENGVDNEIDEVNKQIEEIDKEILEFDDEKIGGIDKEILKNGEKINKAKSIQERDNLYDERNKLFEKRSALFEKRNEIFNKRNKLFEKRNKLFEKRSVLLTNRRKAKRRSNNNVTIYRWDTNKKDFSVADGNVDLKWINRVEQIGILEDYNLKSIAIEGTSKELASVQYRIKEIHDILENKQKIIDKLKEAKITHMEEYIQLYTDVMDYNKRLYMLAEFYNRIYTKMVSEK